MRTLPDVADAFIPEESGYPTLDIKVDRTRAGRLGLTQKEVVDNVITALTSNQMIAPSIWIDRKTGNDYFLTAQYSESDIDSYETLLDIPVLSRNTDKGHSDSVLLRNIASVAHESHPAEADHYDIQRVVDVLVDPATSDLGGTQTAIQNALKNVQLPKERPDRFSRLGRRHAEVIFELRFRTLDGGRAALFSDGGAVQIVSRSGNHHVRGSDGAHRRHLDASAHRHHTQY